MPATLPATTIGSEIARLRRDARLSQAELAERVGTHQPNVSDWENDVHLPTLPTLVKIGTALGLDRLEHLIAVSLISDPDMRRELTASCRDAIRRAADGERLPYMPSLATVARLLELDGYERLAFGAQETSA